MTWARIPPTGHRRSATGHRQGRYSLNREAQKDPVVRGTARKKENIHSGGVKSPGGTIVNGASVPVRTRGK